MADYRWLNVTGAVIPYIYDSENTMFYVSVDWMGCLFFNRQIIPNAQLEDAPFMYGYVLDEMVSAIDRRIQESIACLN